MVAAAPPQGSFGAKLQSELGRRNIGARTLARKIVEQHGGTVDDRRRTIVRWLRGATPVARNREIVEDVLGLERGMLRGDDEEDERLFSPVSISLDVNALLHDLEARVVESLLERMEVAK